MSSIFTINGKTYKSREFDFGMLCELEESNISIDEIQEKPFSFVRKYFAMCSGLNPQMASIELNNHIIGGGDLEDIMGVITNEIENSGFFRSLNKESKEDAPKSKSKKTESK